LSTPEDDNDTVDDDDEEESDLKEALLLPARAPGRPFTALKPPCTAAAPGTDAARPFA
jgi:hypothetical protein